MHDSDDFQKLEKQIDRYVELKERKSVPLNEEKFMAERAELNTEQRRGKAVRAIGRSEPSGREARFLLQRSDGNRPGLLAA